MALAASNLRLGYIPLGFFAIGFDLYAFLKEYEKWACNLDVKRHILAGVCARNIGHGAGLAQVRRPLLSLQFEQAAFLRAPAPVIITIKMRAFAPGGRLHD